LNNISKLRKQLETVKAEIDRLSGFRDTPFVRKFRRQLEGEKSVILQKISKITQTKATKERLRSEVINLANKNRSEKMRRTWRYVKVIQKNYAPDKPVKEIRSALKKHREGLETDIPDVAWRNPSP
jgi:hypothetical protein